jgi:hypothetical protein
VSADRPDLARRAAAVVANARYDGSLGTVGVSLVFGPVAGAALGAAAYQLVRGDRP